MAFNGFANFGDIKGESTDKDHKDWVAVLGFDHGVTRRLSSGSAGARGAEAADHSEFTIVKLLDAATPKLYEAACKGTHLPEVVIELWRAGGTNPLKYMEFKLKEVLVSGVIGAGDPAGPSGFPTETIKMTYGAIEWTYTKQKPDGSPAGNVSTKWSVARTPGARSGRRVR
jgi:type VI secretion system secreted protein Hcp